MLATTLNADQTFGRGTNGQTAGRSGANPFARRGVITMSFLKIVTLDAGDAPHKPDLLTRFRSNDLQAIVIKDVFSVAECRDMVAKPRTATAPGSRKPISPSRSGRSSSAPTSIWPTMT